MILSSLSTTEAIFTLWIIVGVATHVVQIHQQRNSDVQLNISTKAADICLRIYGFNRGLQSGFIDELSPYILRRIEKCIRQRLSSVPGCGQRSHCAPAQFIRFYTGQPIRCVGVERRIRVQSGWPSVSTLQVGRTEITNCFIKTAHCIAPVVKSSCKLCAFILKCLLYCVYKSFRLQNSLGMSSFLWQSLQFTVPTPFTVQSFFSLTDLILLFCFVFGLLWGFFLPSDLIMTIILPNFTGKPGGSFI